MNFRYSLIVSLLLGLSITGFAQKETPDYRPQYHFTPPKNWTNDPNGLVYSDGKYHLFYQYNPFGNQWGHMSWGHATSTDLINWNHLSLALPEYNNADGSESMIFSGSAVVDKQNSSGFFTKGQTNGLVAIYTAFVHRNLAPIYQHQNLAYSGDDGKTWQYYKQNPVLDLKSKDFRDPKVFWYAPQQKWVMTVSKADRQQAYFYESHDLKSWKFMSRWGRAGNTARVWECPDLIEVSVQGEKTKKWVLFISSGNPQELYPGMQYFVGEFDGKSFKPDQAYEEPEYVDFGKDFFAGVTFNNAPNDRKILLGWVNDWEYANDIPTGGEWRGAFSVPRELSLKRTAKGFELIQWPVSELKKGQKEAFSTQNLKVTSNYEVPFRGNIFDLELTIKPQQAKVLELKLLQSTDEETVLRYDVSEQTLSLDRTHSGNVSFNPKFASVEKVKVPLKDGKLQLRVLADKSIIEVFAQNGEKTLTDLVFPLKKEGKLSISSSGGESVINLLKINSW